MRVHSPVRLAERCSVLASELSVAPKVTPASKSGSPGTPTLWARRIVKLAQDDRVFVFLLHVAKGVDYITAPIRGFGFTYAEFHRNNA
jgi:hypothetical protein